MKKAFFVITLMACAVFAFAHAPASIKLEFDSATRMLKVSVIHPIANTPVSDPAKHYIKDITVTVNGKVVITEAITSQQSAGGETSSFLLNVKPGDRITVRGVCSVSGVNFSELVIK